MRDKQKKGQFPFFSKVQGVGWWKEGESFFLLPVVIMLFLVEVQLVHFAPLCLTAPCADKAVPLLVVVVFSLSPPPCWCFFCCADAVELLACSCSGGLLHAGTKKPGCVAWQQPQPQPHHHLRLFKSGSHFQLSALNFRMLEVPRRQKSPISVSSSSEVVPVHELHAVDVNRTT